MKAESRYPLPPPPPPPSPPSLLRPKICCRKTDQKFLKQKKLPNWTKVKLTLHILKSVVHHFSIQADPIFWCVGRSSATEKKEELIFFFFFFFEGVGGWRWWWWWWGWGGEGSFLGFLTSEPQRKCVSRTDLLGPCHVLPH